MSVEIHTGMPKPMRTLIAQMGMYCPCKDCDPSQAHGRRCQHQALVDAALIYHDETVNTPHTLSFLRDVAVEAQHQRERWGTEHDAGKDPAAWFWLVGHLASKSLYAMMAGDKEKARHHTISTAAVLLNQHARLAGVDSIFQPGTQQGGGA